MFDLWLALVLKPRSRKTAFEIGQRMGHRFCDVGLVWSHALHLGNLCAAKTSSKACNFCSGSAKAIEQRHGSNVFTQ